MTTEPQLMTPDRTETFRAHAAHPHQPCNRAGCIEEHILVDCTPRPR